MNKVPAIVKGILVLVVIVAIGVAIGMISSKKPAPEPSLGEHAAKTSPIEPDQPERPFTPVRTPELAPTQVRTSAPAFQLPQANPLIVAPVAQNIITNWEDKLDDILGSDLDEKQKASQMAAVLPLLPEEGQEEVAQHLANLVDDEDYGTIAGFLTNSALSEAVLDVFLSDSLNRPNAVKLPLLLEVARNPQNPKAEEAKEILELFLDEDYGDDWAQWNTHLQEWMKENPD